MCGVIYLITNKIDGKKYVGQTTQLLEIRFNEHARRKKSLLGNAIRKYGREDFSREIIEECETPAQLNEREIFWIAHFNCKVPDGYNLTDGGEGNFNPSDQTRAKMSEIKTGEKNPFFGKHHTDETRAVISAKNRGKRKTPEHRAKLAAAQTGKHLSDETRAKMSAKRKGVPKSQEHRAKISFANRGKNRGNTSFKNLLTEIDKRQITYAVLAKILGVACSTFSQKMSG